MATEDLDAEVLELREQARQLVGLAYRLSRDIDRTVDDLQEFTGKSTMQVDTRDPNTGPDEPEPGRGRTD